MFLPSSLLLACALASTLASALACAPLRLHRLDAGDVAAHRAHARGVLQLPGRPLEAQVELLLLEAGQLLGELVGSHRPSLLRFHLCSTPEPVLALPL